MPDESSPPERPRLSLKLKKDTAAQVVPPTPPPPAPEALPKEPPKPGMRLRLVSNPDEPVIEDAPPPPPPAPAPEAAPATAEPAPQEQPPPAPPRKYVDAPPPPRKKLVDAPPPPKKVVDAPPPPSAPIDAPPPPRKFVDAPPPPRKKPKTGGETVPPMPAATDSPPAAQPAPAGKPGLTLKPTGTPFPSKAPAAAEPQAAEADTDEPATDEAQTEAAPRKPRALVLALLVLLACGGYYIAATQGLVPNPLGEQELTPEQQAAAAKAELLERVGGVTDLADPPTTDETPAATTPVSPAIPRDPATSQMVDALPLTSVLVRATGTRAIIGGVVYNEGDLIDPAPGLRLGPAIPERHTLTFTDARGAIYERSY